MHAFQLALESLNRAAPIFEFRIFGRKMFIVTSQKLFSGIWKNSADMDFWPSQVPFIKQVFHVDITTLPGDSFARAIEPIHTLLKGSEVDEMFARAAETAKLLYEQLIGNEDTVLDVVDVAKKVAMQATVVAIMGEEAWSKDLPVQFEAFDSKMSLLAAGIPSLFLGEAMTGLKFLRSCSEKVGISEAVTKAIRERVRVFEEFGMSRMEIGMHNSTILWVSLANTVPSAQWMLSYLASDPTLQEAIFHELGNVSSDHLTREQANGSPLLSSVMQEVLRLHLDTMSVRTVIADETTISSQDGVEYRLRKGDELYLATYLYHHDPELFPEPDKFVATRHLGENPLPIYGFGGGRSMCSGRVFVQSEIKMFAAVTILNYKMEALDPIPGSKLRDGLGVSHMKTGMRVRFIRRK